MKCVVFLEFSVLIGTTGRRAVTWLLVSRSCSIIHVYSGVIVHSHTPLAPISWQGWGTLSGCLWKKEAKLSHFHVVFMSFLEAFQSKKKIHINVSLNGDSGVSVCVTEHDWCVCPAGNLSRVCSGFWPLGSTPSPVLWFHCGWAFCCVDVVLCQEQTGSDEAALVHHWSSESNSYFSPDFSIRTTLQNVCPNKDLSLVI